MREIFSVFGLPSWLNWFFDHPFLCVIAGVSLGLISINLHNRLREGQISMSAQTANIIVLVVIVITVLILRR